MAIVRKSFPWNTVEDIASAEALVYALEFDGKRNVHAWRNPLTKTIDVEYDNELVENNKSA